MSAKRPKDVGILQHHARLLAPLGVFPISPLFSRLASYLVLFRLFFFVAFFFSSSSLRAIDEYQFFLCFIYFIIYRNSICVFLFGFSLSPRQCPFSHFVFLSLIYNCFFFITSRVHSLFYDLPRSIRSLIPRCVIQLQVSRTFFFLSPALFLFLQFLFTVSVFFIFCCCPRGPIPDRRSMSLTEISPLH